MFLLDIPVIFKWWLVLFIEGLIFFPITSILFRKFTDAGYGLSKTLGLVLLSYVIFLSSILKISGFSLINILLLNFILLIVNALVLKNNWPSFKKNITKKLKLIIFQEFLFTSGLLFWSYVRAHQPDIRGLEKFMDFGFLNSILRSNFLPPADMWFAGKSINYYWFGHFITAVLTKLSTIPSTISYNLMLATILGLTLISAFSIVSSIVKTVSENKNLKPAVSAGIISAILLVFAGNFHTPFYVLKNGSDKYWYPDATRFIGYNPETEDKTIHEFPIYSFVVADLHGHLLNLPIVLLYIALLWELADFKNDKKKLLLNVSACGFVLGVMIMTNTWDFANYLLATGFAVGLLYVYKKKVDLNSIWKPGIWVFAVFCLGLLTGLPFLLNFKSIAEGVSFVHSHSPLWQLAILWGFPALLSLMFFIFLKNHKNKIKSADIFIIALHAASWILIILPEIMYVKDIYTASYYRANTMFKLTYQAYVMFYLTSGYIAVRTIQSLKDKSYKFLSIIFFIVIFSSILSYSYFSIKSYYEDLNTYRQLQGDIWLKSFYPDEYLAIDWFNKNIKGQPVILEAPGDSYTDFNVISSYTGLPTVSGWFVHEWLWRGTADIPQARVADISNIYQTPNANLANQLLKKYNVSYVIVGTFEHQKFPTLNEKKFTDIGNPVFRSNLTTIYKIK